MRRMILTVVVVGGVSVAVVAQQSSPSPAFEVATIRPSGTSLDGGESGGVQPSGRFAATNIFLYDLTRVVFGLQQHEITAGERLPSWVRTERWDIIGKGPPVTDEEAQRPLYLRMMQNLLMRNERNRLWGTGVPLTEMTRILSLRAGRPVVDGTNLTGSFDLDVKFTPTMQPIRSVAHPGLPLFRNNLGCASTHDERW